MNHNTAIEIALKKNEEAKLSDFKDTIEVTHQDGSCLVYVNAVFEWLDDVWFTVRTEHCGVQVFHSGDIRWVSKIKREYLYYGKDEK